MCGFATTSVWIKTTKIDIHQNRLKIEWMINMLLVVNGLVNCHEVTLSDEIGIAKDTRSIRGNSKSEKVLLEPYF